MFKLIDNLGQVEQSGDIIRTIQFCEVDEIVSAFLVGGHQNILPAIRYFCSTEKKEEIKIGDYDYD